jgi:tRNA G46 methylase TrmB
MQVILNPRLFILPDSEIHDVGLQNLTYGSLTQRGISTLVKTLQEIFSSENLIGFDLGCGDGELIYHLAREIPSSVWEGVEISEHRISAQHRDVCIWQGDMLQENFRLYNVLHADNLCLEDSIAIALEEKIAREFTGIYISYRKPESILFLKKAIYLKTVPTETTWTVHPIHFYSI